MRRPRVTSRVTKCVNHAHIRVNGKKACGKLQTQWMRIAGALIGANRKAVKQVQRFREAVVCAAARPRAIYCKICRIAEPHLHLCEAAELRTFQGCGANTCSSWRSRSAGRRWNQSNGRVVSTRRGDKRGSELQLVVSITTEACMGSLQDRGPVQWRNATAARRAERLQLASQSSIQMIAVVETEFDSFSRYASHCQQNVSE